MEYIVKYGLMISKDNIKTYKGFFNNKNYISISPNKVLQPYISKYFISFPDKQILSKEYTILPNASSTLVLTVDANKINGSLYGVNTKPLKVGDKINKIPFLLLIEFHAGGLYPFISVDQIELVNTLYPIDILDKNLMGNLELELEKSQNIETLIEGINNIFIARLMNSKYFFNFTPVLKNIIEKNGAIDKLNMAFPYSYSERQTRRLFLRHIGINPNKFMRIVRANFALKLIKSGKSSFLDIVEETGYFDQPHFIHEFKIIHGITPQEYKQNMSVFYNDNNRM